MPSHRNLRLGSLWVAIGPRGGLVVLVAAHLVLTFLQAWPLPQQLDQWFGPSSYGVWNVLVSASAAVQFAQMALVAAYITLGGNRLLPGIVRGLLLLLWMELAHMAGSYWLDAGRDTSGFEESIGTAAWNFAFLLLPLLAYRLFARRELIVRTVPHGGKLQFRIMHLLLVITETAALLAAIRAFVVENDEWRDELWRAIRDYPISFASYDLIALSILATIPAVIISVRWHSLPRAATVLLVWQLLLSGGFFLYRVLFPDLDPEFPFAGSEDFGWLLLIAWLQIAAFCLSAGAIIWLTLAIVRWLGYDFLPVRGGRQSSEATSSA